MPPLISFLFFTSLVGALTWRLTRRDDHHSSTGYFLAGRTLTGGYIAGSLLLTNLSTEQLVGLNGGAYQDGICVMAWEVIAAASLVVLALAYLPRYLKSGIATVPQFLENRFDAGTRNLTTLIFLSAYVAILLPIILYTGAKGLSEILNVRELTGLQSDRAVMWLSIWTIGIIGSIYAIFGGLRTVAVSDTLNGFGLLIGGGLIVYYGLKAVDSSGPGPALETLMRAHPEKFNSLGGPQQAVPFSTLFTGVVLLNLFYWTTNQQIIQRALGAKSLKEGQKGVLLAGMFKVLAPLILVLPGVMAYHLFRDEITDADRAYGVLVRNVLPAPFVGFFAAAVFGAILSSFNSVLNSAATLYSLGIYKSLIRKEADEAQVIRSGKRVGTVIALFSMSVAPLLDNLDRGIFAHLQKMNGLYFIPIFSVMLVGLVTRRVPALAAKLALVLGCTVIALGYFHPVLEQSVSAMHEFHFLGAVFAGLVLLMLAIGLVFPRETPWEQQNSGDVDLTPWKLAWPAGAGLLAFVLALYVWFADLSVLGAAPGAPPVEPNPILKSSPEL